MKHRKCLEYDSELYRVLFGFFFQQIASEFDANINILPTYYHKDNKGAEFNWAFFTQFDYALHDNFKIVAGLRLDQAGEQDLNFVNNPKQATETNIIGKIEKGDIELIPRLAAIYFINKHNIVKFLYGQAISRPSFFQNTDNLSAGKPNISPEEIQTFEINYITNGFNNFTINASLFHNRLENLILRTMEIDNNILYTYFRNLGELVTNGAELTIQFQPLAKFYTELSMTLQETTDKRNGYDDIEVAYSPCLLGYLKAAYCFDSGIILGIAGRFVDEMETAYDDATASRIGEKIDGYLLLDINLRINNLGGKSRLYFNIHSSNIFDTEYQYPTYVSNTWQTRGSIGEGRIVTATIGYEF